MTPAERAQRAIAAKALLDDPLMQEAFASIEQDLTDQWKACGDPAERDNLWRTVNVMELLKVWLRSAASHDLAALRRVK